MSVEEDDAAHRAWELEMEMAMADRGRTRSRSILASHTSEEAETPADGAEDVNERIDRHSSGRRSRNEGLEPYDPSDRRRSRSFTSRNPHESTETGDEAHETERNTDQMVKRAASLSRMYLAGSAPVDVRNLQKEGKKVEVIVPTGALSTQALDALSEGLQSFSVGETVNGGNSVVTTLPDTRSSLKEDEAALEEKQMAEEEEKERKHERLSITRKSIAAKASFFKGKMFKRKDSFHMSSQTIASGGKDPAFSATTKEATETADESNLHPLPAPKTSIKRHKLKLLLLGDSGVGKTSLMRVFSGDAFSESMLATAGVDFKLRNIVVGDDEIALQIWDTAGQERFHRITATYYKGANGIVLVYDVNDKKSYDNVGYWMNNIRQYASPNMPAMLLVGNKIDLLSRVVSTEEGAATAKQYDVRFIETSAKTSENTNGALETIARDAFMMSLNGDVTQKMLMEKEKSLLGRRNKENCTIS